LTSSSIKLRYFDIIYFDAIDRLISEPILCLANRLLHLGGTRIPIPNKPEIVYNSI